MNNLYISNIPVSYRHDLRSALRTRMSFKTVHFSDGEGFIGPEGRPLLRHVGALLKKEKPHVVIAPEYSPVTLQLAACRRRYGFRLVSLCDDSIDMIQGNDFTAIHRLARRVVPPCVDEIILSTPAAFRWYQEHYGKGLFMPIIADERRVRPELERVLPLSERVRPSRKPVIAFVGRFVGLKNIPTLIEAFRPLKDRARLVLIGDGPDRPGLEALAPEALFTGMLSGDDLLAWYNVIDILVLPSTREAYGAVTGEALMAGAKVVVSSRAGSRDLVREGENGYVVDPMDVQGLFRALDCLLDSVETGRELSLRENLLPYRFETCIDDLIGRINSL